MLLTCRGGIRLRHISNHLQQIWTWLSIYQTRKSPLKHCSNTTSSYNTNNSTHMAKFMPCFNGPYWITFINKKHSTVMLELPNTPHAFPVFHTLEIQPYKDIDDTPPWTCTYSPHTSHYWSFCNQSPPLSNRNSISDLLVILCCSYL